ncbi:MAG: hypothetical protein COB66_08570 [Coxiella sp. (in: Bacteria)]|nr:MAG: hypothetical protein COB66_08570 [Coxiella sp. (in: g-proteobacteria)]
MPPQRHQASHFNIFRILLSSANLLSYFFILYSLSVDVTEATNLAQKVFQELLEGTTKSYKKSTPLIHGDMLELQNALGNFDNATDHTVVLVGQDHDSTVHLFAQIAILMYVRLITSSVAVIHELGGSASGASEFNFLDAIDSIINPPDARDKDLNKLKEFLATTFIPMACELRDSMRVASQNTMIDCITLFSKFLGFSFSKAHIGDSNSRLTDEFNKMYGDTHLDIYDHNTGKNNRHPNFSGNYLRLSESDRMLAQDVLNAVNSQRKRITLLFTGLRHLSGVRNMLERENLNVRSIQLPMDLESLTKEEANFRALSESCLQKDPTTPQMIIANAAGCQNDPFLTRVLKATADSYAGFFNTTDLTMMPWRSKPPSAITKDNVHRLFLPRITVRALKTNRADTISRNEL